MFCPHSITIVTNKLEKHLVSEKDKKKFFLSLNYFVEIKYCSKWKISASCSILFFKTVLSLN